MPPFALHVGLPVLDLEVVAAVDLEHHDSAVRQLPLAVEVPPAARPVPPDPLPAWRSQAEAAAHGGDVDLARAPRRPPAMSSIARRIGCLCRTRPTVRSGGVQVARACRCVAVRRPRARRTRSGGAAATRPRRWPTGRPGDGARRARRRCRQARSRRDSCTFTPGNRWYRAPRWTTTWISPGSRPKKGNPRTSSALNPARAAGPRLSSTATHRHWARVGVLLWVTTQRSPYLVQRRASTCALTPWRADTDGDELGEGRDAVLVGQQPREP